MQTTSQLTASISQNNQQPIFTQQTLQENSQSTKQLISKQQVGGMFAKWKIYFKTKMKDEEWGLTNILLWTAVLNEFDVTEQELIEGTTKACFARELNGWPPTTATDFINIFRADTASEYPTANDAFTTACQNCGMKGDIERDWKHAVVYETANRIGWGKLASATDYFFKTFEAVYDQVVNEHKAGKTFVIPQSHQVAYEHTPVEVGSEADKRISEKLAELRRMAV